MNPVDGNAIAGLLWEAFGHEMTTAIATCATCGTSGALAEYHVYLSGLGDVVRCRACDGVVAVLVTVREITCVNLDGLSALAAP